MKAASALILLGLAASGYMSQSLKGEIDVPAKQSGLDAHETNAGASVLGQFRTTTTGWLWLRTDLYLHNGVEMRSLSDSEIEAGRKGVGSADEELGAVLGDDRLVTLVPNKDRDFRGIFGDIERETQTFKRMENHSHNEPKDALPLFRLMTWVDPQFVPGWTTAATIIADERTDAAFAQAINLLDDGLKENPTSVVILNELGRLYVSRKKDYPKALSYLMKAIEQPLEPAKLEEDESEAFLNAFRWTALCFRELNQRDKQRATAAYGLLLFPDDRVLARLYSDPPYFLSEEGQRAWLKDQIEAESPKSPFGDHDHDHDGHPDHAPGDHDDHDHHGHDH